MNEQKRIMADMFKTDRFTFKRDFCTEYVMFNQQRRNAPFRLTLFDAASLMGKMLFNIRKVDKKTKDQKNMIQNLLSWLAMIVF